MTTPTEKREAQKQALRNKHLIATVGNTDIVAKTAGPNNQWRLVRKDWQIVHLKWLGNVDKMLRLDTGGVVTALELAALPEARLEDVNKGRERYEREQDEAFVGSLERKP